MNSSSDRDSKSLLKAASQLWQFNYKRGPAGFTGIVAAWDEKTAFAVARRWCEHNNVRVLAGKVSPLILADESILATEAENPAPAIGDVISA